MSADQPIESPEPMDQFTAVFNGHVNNAHRRAYAEMQRKCPSYLAAVKKRARKGGGIMAIFEFPCHRGFERYARLVKQFVNESASENSGVDRK